MTQPRGKDEKHLHNLEDVYKCLSCDDIVEQDATHLKCPQHHALCSECAHVFTESVLGADLSAFPPSCSLCKSQFSPQMFEHQLNMTQRARYDDLVKNMMAMSSAGPHEILARCPFCSYFEVREKSPGAMFTWCKERRCQKVSCIVCKVQCGIEGEHHVLSPKAFKHHTACAELATIHQKTLEAIGKAQGRQCPSCGVLGRKDDRCTHMSCVCGIKWCYICCTDITHLTELADHNRSSKKCAMYMEEYSEVDEDWPAQSNEALEHFHRRLAYAALHKIYRSNTTEFERLITCFPAILGGFGKINIHEGVAELPELPDWEEELDGDMGTDEIEEELAGLPSPEVDELTEVEEPEAKQEAIVQRAGSSSRTWLRKQPQDETANNLETTRVPNGQRIQIIEGLTNGFLKISWNGEQGWIRQAHLQIISSFESSGDESAEPPQQRRRLA